MIDEQLHRATMAVQACFNADADVPPTRSTEFYRHVAAEALAAARSTSVHDRAVSALAAWLNGGDHEVEGHLYHAAEAALRLLNRGALASLGIELEALDAAGLAAPHSTEETRR